MARRSAQDCCTAAIWRHERAHSRPGRVRRGQHGAREAERRITMKREIARGASSSTARPRPRALLNHTSVVCVYCIEFYEMTASVCYRQSTSTLRSRNANARNGVGTGQYITLRTRTCCVCATTHKSAHNVPRHMLGQGAYLSQTRRRALGLTHASSSIQRHPPRAR